MAETLPEFEDARSLVAWLAEQRNDLEAPAIGIAPAIGDCLAALKASDDCLLARMSGSGATCFGLYPDHDKAAAAARSIAAERPEWWVSAGHLGDWSARAMPKLSS